MPLLSSVETVLFVAGKPLSVKTLAKVVGESPDAVASALGDLQKKYSGEDSGIWLLEASGEWQLATNPGNKLLAEQFVKVEISGELTRPQLETLTVISYCGPITKPDLEQIRGVNCSLILRNLLLRGLIEEREDAGELLPTYSVTVDYLRYLGLSSVAELPDYATLHDHSHIRAALGTSNESPSATEAAPVS